MTDVATTQPGLLSGDAFRLLAESTQDHAIFLLDTEGRVATWTAGARHLKQYRAEEIIGAPLSIFYTPEDLQAGKPEIEISEATRTGRYVDEGWRVRKDGSRFWASVVLTALRDPAGRLIGFGKVTRDVTDRRRAEEHLRESEERFRLLVESVVDYAIFLLDPTGKVQTWNAGAQRIKGYAASEIIGTSFTRFYPPDVAASGYPLRQLEIAAREGHAESEGWRVRKDGTRFWANVVITALRDATGRLQGYAKVTRDLTARKAAEEQAKELARAQEASRARSSFMSMMAHELRSPLTAFKVYVEGVRRRVARLDPGLDPTFGRLRAQLDRLERLVDDLGESSRMEAGQELPLRLADHDLGEIVTAAVRFHQEAIAGQNHRIHTVELASDDPPMPVRVDRTRIEQVLANLIGNALKYSPRGGTIRVSLRRREGSYELVVADEGIGIPAGDLARLSERYFRASNVSDENFPGIGLGLAITSEIVRRHGGSISFASELGKGTTVTIVLPAGGGEGAGASAPA